MIGRENKKKKKKKEEKQKKEMEALVLALFALCSTVIADVRNSSSLDSHLAECKSALDVCSFGEICSSAKFQNSSNSFGKFSIPLLIMCIIPLQEYGSNLLQIVRVR